MALPGVRSGHKPKPFVKPGITLSTDLHGSKRAWRHVPAERVEPDDIVRGLGRLVEKHFAPDVLNGGADVKLVFQNGKQERYRSGDSVIAFTEVEGEPVG